MEHRNAEILDRLKRREDAQELRWREFGETLDPNVLRLYLSKLDDFAEFDELDRALALAKVHEDIYLGLDFFLAWPRLDLAAAHVLRHQHDWEGRHYDDLAPAAEALSAKEPLAAVVLYRVLVEDILRRGIGMAYPHAGRYVGELARLMPNLPEGHGLSTHAAFLAELKRIDGMVSSGRAFDALKAIRQLYPIEDRILNNQEMAPATIEQIRKEIAPWR